MHFLPALILCLASTAVRASHEGIPDPLGLEQALDYADKHPRSQLDVQTSKRYPRRQPLYLDCHRLAYSSTSGIDNRRNRVTEALVAPVAAQGLEILERFFDTLLADMSYSRYNEAMAVAYIQFDRAGARRDLGQYSELRVLELESVYQDIRQRRTASIASQRLTRSLLAQAINYPLTLPRDLTTPQLPTLPDPLPDPDEVVAAASSDNAWLIDKKGRSGEVEQRLIDMELRQQALELLLRLESLGAARDYASTEALWRDLKLDESRTLYEQEVKSDLGYSMSQQTRAQLHDRQVGYCQALTWAELNALQGRPVWSPTQGAE